MKKNAGEYIIKANTRNKIKELFILLFALVLAVLVALFNVDKFRAVIPVDSTMDNFVDNILFPVGRIASWIVISIILFCLIACIKNISDQKNLLYINEKGFEENISKQSVGFVEWCDVESLAVKQFFNSKMYGIKLKTPDFKYHMDKCKADSCTHTE